MKKYQVYLELIEKNGNYNDYQCLMFDDYEKAQEYFESWCLWNLPENLESYVKQNYAQGIVCEKIVMEINEHYEIDEDTEEETKESLYSWEFDHEHVNFDLRR